MQKKRNILFLCTWYPNRIQALLGNFIQRHAEAVSGFASVHVLAAVADKNLSQEFEIIETDLDGVHAMVVYYKDSMRILNVWKRMTAFHMGRSELRKKGIEVELAHVHVAFPSGLYALWLKATEKLPYVITEHWTRFLPQNKSSLGPVPTFLSRLIYRKASAMMPVSLNLGQALQNYMTDATPMTVIPNAVNTEIFFPPEKEPYNLIPELLHVSSLYEEAKNVNGILRCIKKLKDEGFELKLKIIHDDPSPKHEHYIKELGLEACVQFLGNKNMNGVADEMRKSDAFILFSRFENSPVVLLESIACGLPSIATRVGGIAEHVKPEFGLLVDSEDESGLRNAILEIIRFRWKYKSDVMAAYAKENFSYASTGKKIADVYETVLH